MLMRRGCYSINNTINKDIVKDLLKALDLTLTLTFIIMLVEKHKQILGGLA